MESTYSPCPQCLALNRVVLGMEKNKAPVCGKCKALLTLKQGVTELSAGQLQALIVKSPLPVVVDFWAPWCGPCLAFAPTFKQVAQKKSGSFVFAKLDTQSHQAAASSYRIQSIPTLLLFSGGKEKQRISGALGAHDFDRWLESSR